MGYLVATSGTVGATSFNVATLIEKAYRRCNVLPGLITPELIDIAKENLFLLFNNFSNRGINLWCVDTPMLGITNHKAEYDLPVGTIDVLNAVYRRPTALDTTIYATTALSQTFDVASATVVNLIGFKVSTQTTSAVISASADGATFTDLVAQSKVFTIGDWHWIAVEPSALQQYWKITFPTATAITDYVLANTYTDLVMSRLNKDDYQGLPNKRFEGAPSLQYWMNRQMTPTVTLWPVPNTELACIYLITHRQIQDVGAITNTIEIPDRWVDAVLWGLASMCAVEIPTMPEDRIQLCLQMAGESLRNADSEERDTAPIYLAPNISVYNA